VKRCSKCRLVKPLDDFYVMRAARDGHRPNCKVCESAARRAKYRENPKREVERVLAWQRANKERHLAAQRRRRQKPERKRKEREGHLLRKFGNTLDEYDRLLKEQGGGCGICGAPHPETGSFHVDHDHETGRVRGLLCFRCNAGLGQFDESVEKLLSAIAYLEGVRG
jgi:hypothetical protein